MVDKIFTKKSITITTFFGGPLAAGYLLSKNFKKFGDKKASRLSILGAIFTTLFIIATLVFLPDSTTDRIPAFIFPILYTILTNLIVNRYQEKQITTFLENGGQKKGVGEPILFGFLSSLLIFGCITFLSSEPIGQGYENSLKLSRNTKIHYDNNISDETCESIAQVILESGFIDESEGLDLLLKDEISHYKLRFILLDANSLKDTLTMYDFYSYELYLNENISFLDKGIKIGFTDQSLKSKYTIPKMNFESNGPPKVRTALLEYKISKNHSVYYNEEMAINDIESLAKSVKTLKGYFPTESTIELVFLDNGNDYTLKLFVNDVNQASRTNNSRLKSTHHYIQGGVKKKINLVLVDIESHKEKAIKF